MALKRSSIKGLVLAGVLLAAHLALAIPTARGIAQVQDRWLAWRSSELEKEFLERISKAKTQVRPDLLEAVESLQAHLKAKDIKLHVILFPTKRSLHPKEGETRDKPSPAARNLRGAELALQQKGIPVVNLLNSAYHHYHRDPVGSFSDEFHYTTAFLETMSKDLIQGKVMPSSLFAGDCYARNFGATVNYMDPKLKVKSLWKNGTSQLMAYEISRCGDEELAGVKDVYWWISDIAIGNRSVKFPGCAPARLALPEGSQVVYCKLIQQTKIDSRMGQTSAYKDALVVNRFKKADGSFFLGIAPIMVERNVQEAIRQWEPGASMKLTLVDWDEKCAKERTYREIQMIDDVQDFVLPRYWIDDWIYAPSQEAPSQASATP